MLVILGITSPLHTQVKYVSVRRILQIIILWTFRVMPRRQSRFTRPYPLLAVTLSHSNNRGMTWGTTWGHLGVGRGGGVKESTGAISGGSGTLNTSGGPLKTRDQDPGP